MNWFPVPSRMRGEPIWLVRFECGHNQAFYRRPMIESRLRYGCHRCGWQYVTALCETPGDW